MHLDKILELIQTHTGIAPIPFHLEGKTGIWYKYYSLLDNGIVRQDKLEINITDYDLEKIEVLDKQVRNALLVAGDRKEVLELGLSGGGIEQVDDYERINKVLIYIIKIRSDL